MTTMSEVYPRLTADSLGVEFIDSEGKYCSVWYSSTVSAKVALGAMKMVEPLKRGDTTSVETRVTDPTTGGQKGKKPEEYALIPVEALAEVARVYGYGAGKYDPHNWRRGYDWSLSYSALQRHVNQFWAGQSLDSESGLHHLAHAAFHLFSLMTFDNLDGEEVPVYTQKDDRYKR
jgi:hypothetical protein